MSAALQRVVVRLLHDPDLARATARAGLNATEHAWLEAVDPRRWRADPMRRYRLLQALIEEYPVAAARVVRRAGVARLDRFFESDHFHDSVQKRRILAIDFGGWLAQMPDCADAARLEGAIAQVRRTPRRPAPAGPNQFRPDQLWRRAPWIAVGQGHLQAWQRQRDCLATHPAGMLAAVLDAAVTLPPVDGPVESWLVDGDVSPQVEALVPALAQFLTGLEAPVRWLDLRQRLANLGADLNDIPDLLLGFVGDALLTPSAD